MIKRLIEPEWLDTLPPENPLAKGSRKDLEHLNTLMGNRRWMIRALEQFVRAERPVRLAELGAGDGRFFLRVAQCLPGTWKGTSVLLLDRLGSIAPELTEGFAELGWQLQTRRVDVFDWIGEPAAETLEGVTTNLFLHHFFETRLRTLLQGVAQRAWTFVAIEPRRSAWALFCSRLVGCLGCNKVTRHDALVSVRAGFSGGELSALWPDAEGWLLVERPIGFFGHLFIARRKNKN